MWRHCSHWPTVEPSSEANDGLQSVSAALMNLLILDHLENPCQEQKVDYLLLALISNSRSWNEKDEDIASTAEAFVKQNTPRHQVNAAFYLPYIGLVLPSCPCYPSCSSTLSAAASCGLANQCWCCQLLWPTAVATITDELALQRFYCVQLPFLLPGLMIGQIGFMYHSKLFSHLPMNSSNNLAHFIKVSTHACF